MKRELQRALKSVGGSVRALAKQLGIHPSTIYRWRKRGVPKKGTGRQKLTAFKEHRKKERTLARDKRQALAEMLKEARKQGLIPKRYSSSKGPRVGAQTVGYRWTYGVGQWASRQLLASLQGLVAKVRGARQYWQVVLQVSQYGQGALYGDTASAGRYSTVNFSGLGQSKAMRDDMGKTLVEASASSPRLRGKRSLSPALAELFEEVSPDSDRIETYVHALTVYNYNLRTAEQRRDYETNQRRERRIEQWHKTKRTTKKTKPKRRKKR